MKRSLKSKLSPLLLIISIFNIGPFIFSANAEIGINEFLSPKFAVESLPKEWSHKKNGKSIYHFKSASDVEICEKVGLCHTPNNSVRHAARTKEKVLFNVTYEFDKYRRRKTPVALGVNRNNHLIITGCSFVLGTSISESETLPYHLAQKMNFLRPYNYGIAGSGTNSMLAQMRQHITQESVPETEGVFVYVFIDFHVPRANGFAMEREWLLKTPAFSQSKSMENLGFWDVAEPNWTNFFHSTQTILKSVGINFNYPKRMEKHDNYVCDLIQAAKVNYLQKYPKGNFIVYSHPYQPMKKTLISCLKSKSINFVLSAITLGPKDLISFDEHPTSYLNSKIAHELEPHLTSLLREK